MMIKKSVMSWRVVKLKEVLKQYRIEHRVQDDTNYKQVTISKHDGVKFRGYKLGKNIGRKRQFIIDLKKHPKTLMLVRQGVYDGAIGIAPKEVDGCIATENMPMFDIVNINIDYLGLLIKSPLFKEKLSKIQTTGSAQKSIHERVILEIEIPYPSLTEQEKIVNEFQLNNTNISELSTELTHQLDIVKKLRQSFLREAMQGKLTEDWRKQNPDVESATELLAKIKAEKEQLIKDPPAGRAGKKIRKPLPPITEEEIPFEIPENWVWCRLNDIISFGPSNGLSPRENKKGYGIKCLTLTATTYGVFNGNHYKYVDETIPEESYLWVKENDILLQRGNSIDFVGIAALCENIDDNYIYPDLMIKIRVSKFVSSKFIHQLLISPQWRCYFQNNASGAQKSMPKINQGVVLKTLIPLPPLSEQKAIVAKLDELMAYCDSLEESIKNSQAQNEMLLGQVLREALEPKEKEVATAYL